MLVPEVLLDALLTVRVALYLCVRAVVVFCTGGVRNPRCQCGRLGWAGAVGGRGDGSGVGYSDGDRGLASNPANSAALAFWELLHKCCLRRYPAVWGRSSTLVRTHKPSW